MISEMEDFILTQEEPVSDPSAFAQWCVMREAYRCGMKVLLDGQGADEVLGGYAVFFAADLLDHMVHLRFATFMRELREIRDAQPYSMRFLVATALLSSSGCQEPVHPSCRSKSLVQEVY
jgi:asparagine synthase (glutamine-hydrolysing)